MSSPHVSLLGLYRYDALDRLASIASAGQEVVRRFYLNNRLTTAIQGAVQHSVVQTEDLLLALRRAESDQILFDLLATDQASSVLHSFEAMRNQAYVYSPYGTRSPQTASSCVPGFTGQTIDPVTGHYLLGNGIRAFNPTLMRFTSPDTLSPFAEGGLNSYAYCFGDPVNCTDPTGQSPFFKILMPAFTRAKDLRVPRVLRINVGEVISTSRQAMTRSPDFSGKVSGARNYLRQGLGELDTRSTFINKLDSVNENLISHGNDALSKSHAGYYLRLARKVNAGELSNTGAHVAAAEKWMPQILDPRTRSDGLVGTAFNLGGAFVEGVNDHKLYKTGLALTGSASRKARDIRSTTGSP
ncbi:RHS repeat-associated core domain-containing protein [Pseudomonas syringae]|uniref:RHS repeat-associated core domain-containing protein n=1 Tax=Pseudomonas syringae TaxID=317 RepID=UPI00215A4A47|nr:RHS repeat-associated core domain-containing protein [Pseudomonas syringae]MCR8719542.1 RHS repeat-associated core domain-containing protein [Pseudomonas syringae]